MGTGVAPTLQSPANGVTNEGNAIVEETNLDRWYLAKGTLVTKHVAFPNLGESSRTGD